MPFSKSYSAFFFFFFFNIVLYNHDLFSKIYIFRGNRQSREDWKYCRPTNMMLFLVLKQLHAMKRSPEQRIRGCSVCYCDCTQCLYSYYTPPLFKQVTLGLIRDQAPLSFMTGKLPRLRPNHWVSLFLSTIATFSKGFVYPPQDTLYKSSKTRTFMLQIHSLAAACTKLLLAWIELYYASLSKQTANHRSVGFKTCRRHV